ncbi:nicotinate-nucleotide diphosphorylase [Aaosphaeria arxii CBS 175.79]|uniref:Nicotinate-nucleotide pyrophosphorylase [carboxylating] n=1 Tax=Aaosphaeria arxii CBS 175.79 TaxID=1450172 RepID=A0A6A5XFN7_9PLEO|nr:nicotinate-nucleotide diphosphorylase [Aaosphaeria arxii CBS 175.79]KAF2011666.1 nicotinate-nucleotide diphosphorylase [Aaosphaeria arxii CBS 175.79]
MAEGAPAFGSVAHLLPQTYKRLVSEWLEEDTPSFDYGGFVVGEEISEAKLLGKSEHCATVRGPVRKLLLGERVALNTLARCSGIATKSARLLTLLRKAGYPNILAGTRKTTPGFRVVEKYGMLVGGVDAHRVDLSAMTMLKDNHIVAAGSITNAVRAAKSAGGFAIKVEVECQSFEEADEAIAAGADIVMLDNFTPDGVKVAAAQLKDKWGRGTGDRKAFLVEVSGGLTEENVEGYVCGDIDIVSTSSIHQDTAGAMSFAISTDRLVDLYYENFFPAHPYTMPQQFVALRGTHGMELLLLSMHFVGSVYAPWTPTEPYYEAAYQALCQPNIPRTGFTIQALLMFATAQHHMDRRPESRKMLDRAIELAVELRINHKDFAQLHGEGNPVLEESFRRTYYFLLITDQHFAVVVNSPIYGMRDVANFLDLPCDDDLYVTGQIPTPTPLSEYEVREFADEEIVFSSLAYMYDIGRVVAHIMRVFTETGQFSEALIASADTKVAIWRSLLPACKRDAVKPDGSVDEVMFMAHMSCIVLQTSLHRPLSSLAYSLEELSTESFASPVPFLESPNNGRGAHTARALKAAEMQTRLLAIPCAAERHNLFTLCITATLATAQISACNILLEDRAQSIARDRIRLSIGYLSQMGTFWPLAKKMAKEVRYVARATLSGNPHVTLPPEPDANDEIDIPRDELIWPINPSAQIDIYTGLTMPEWSPGLTQMQPRNVP